MFHRVPTLPEPTATPATRVCRTARLRWLLLILGALTGATVAEPLEAQWDGTEGMAALGGSLYILQRGIMHRVDPTTGAWTVLDGRSPTPDARVAAIAATDEGLYVVQGERLFRVDPATGAWSARDGQGRGGWPSTAAMAAIGNALYIVTENQLYHADPATGTWSPRHGQGAGGWPETAAMAAIGNALYVVTENQLYHADPATGTWSPRHGQGAGGWPETAAMAATGNALYIVTENQLYHADPATGIWSPRHGRARGAWPGTEAMAGLGDWLYVVQGGRLHRVDPGSGDWEVLDGSGPSGGGERSLAGRGSHNDLLPFTPQPGATQRLVGNFNPYSTATDPFTDAVTHQILFVNTQYGQGNSNISEVTFLCRSGTVRGFLATVGFDYGEPGSSLGTLEVRIADGDVSSQDAIVVERPGGYRRWLAFDSDFSQFIQLASDPRIAIRLTIADTGVQEQAVWNDLGEMGELVDLFQTCGAP